MVSTSNVFVIAAGVAGVVALLIFLNAVLMARRGQKAAYYSVRKDSQRAANRTLTLAFFTLVLAGGMLGASFVVPRDGLFVSPLPTPTQALALVQVPTHTPTPQPTSTSVPTKTPSPTQAPTPTTKATPIPEPTSVLATPVVTAAQQSPLPTPGPAAPNKRLTLLAITPGVDANGQPLAASTTFSAGVASVYVFFDFRDVPPSALLRHSWFRNGGLSYFFSQRFPSQDANGTTFVQWSARGGFRPGLYEVRVQLGGVPQFVANFEVK